MDTKFFIGQLDQIIGAFKVMRQQTHIIDLSNLSETDRQSLVSRAIAAVHRISGINSSYSREIEGIIKRTPYLHQHTSAIIGVAQALREDLSLGYLQNFAEIIHAEVFSDFLEMAKHLIESGYKDPAAVLAGSTLESHLKKLAIKNSIPIETDGKPIKADRLNADLAKAKVYELLDQKNVLAWLELRNKAAHGNYNDYTQDQVKLLISSVQDFITRIPG